MAANARRGEVAAVLDGREMRLRLTLGALAELESAFAAEDLAALVARFSTGKLSAIDMMRIVGAGHGFAGNVHALHGAPEWLDDAAALEARAVATARSLAIVDGDHASWPALPTGSRSGAPPRVQWCHGAPGVVTSLAGLARADERHGALLAAGGEFVWRAGPVARNAGLCHGTAGNGFAFLALPWGLYLSSDSR